MEIKKRKEIKSIKAEWLEFLYDEVLAYYETDGRDFSGFHLDKNPFFDQSSISTQIPVGRRYEECSRKAGKRVFL